MTIKIQWDSGNMMVNLDKFFPTGQRRAIALFRLMHKDTRTDWGNVREYFVDKMKAHSECADQVQHELDVLEAEYLNEKGYWMGDCIGNEKKAKAWKDTIKINRKTAEQYQKYIDLFDVYVGD